MFRGGYNLCADTYADPFLRGANELGISLFLFVLASVPKDTARDAAALKTRCDDGHADLIAHIRVNDGTEDHIYIWMSGFADDCRGLIDLEEGQIRAAGHVEEDAARAVNRDVEQFAGDGCFGGFAGALVAFARSYCH